MNRRAFLGVLPAAVFAVQACGRDEQRFQALRRQLRELVTQHPNARVIYAGAEAINCYERGLIRNYPIQEVTGVPQHPGNYMFKSTRIIYMPQLADWQLAVPTSRS